MPRIWRSKPMRWWRSRRPFVGGGRRHRRSLCHGDGRLAPRRHAQAGRDRAGDGRQRQGRSGRRADRDLAWSACDRRGAQDEPYEGHANSTVEVIDASATDVAARVRELTGGNGADIVFNTVGDPYFQAAHKSLALARPADPDRDHRADRAVQHSGILPRPAYLCRHRYAGAVVDRDRRGAAGTGSGFASGHLKPFPIKASAIYPLEQAKAAFIAVAGSSRDRVILRPAW